MGLGLPKWFSGKEQHANAGDARDKSSVPGSGRFPEVGDGKPLQSTYLENPMDRGTWWTIVHRFAKSRTRQQLSTHARPGFKLGMRLKLILMIT